MKNFDFTLNEEFPMCDKELYEKMQGHFLMPEEETFFDTMIYKELNEFAPSFDVIMLEDDNVDSIYIVRCYYAEYKIGCGKEGYRDSSEYALSLKDALDVDMFKFLNKHISLLEWLRSINYSGLNYDRWEE